MTDPLPHTTSALDAASFAHQQDAATPLRAPYIAALLVCFLAAALILYSRAAELLANPDPWLDEAMLALDFLGGSWSGLLQPQPYFEQATSLGYLVVGRLAASSFPEQFYFERERP